MTAPDPGTEMLPGDATGAIALELHGARARQQVSERPAPDNGAGAAAGQRAAAAPVVTTGWEAVYRDHVMAVHRFAAARTGNRPDAEDVTAQVFLRALPRLRPEAAPGEVRAYLLATARTVLAEHWSTRFAGAVEPLDEERAATLPAPPDPEVAPPTGDRGARRVAAILDRLPANYRRVLELRFLSGRSVRETAEELGISVANAKVLQFRALRRAAHLEGDAP